MVQMKKIFITEFAEELNRFREYCNKNGINISEILVVALEPQVKAVCKENGMDYIDTLPFFNTDSHKRVLTKSHELTTLIEENLSFPMGVFDKKVAVDTFIFYSRFYINNFLWILEVMKGIKEKYPRAEVFVYQKEGHKHAFSWGTDPYLAKRDRFVGPLVETFCRENRLKVTVIKETDTTPGKPLLDESDTRRYLRAAARALLTRKLARLSRVPTVFIAAPSYNLDRVCRDIQSVFPHVRAVVDAPAALSRKGYLKLCLKELLNLLPWPRKPKPLTSIPFQVFRSEDFGEHQDWYYSVKNSYRELASAHAGQFVYENCSFWQEFDKKVHADLLIVICGLILTAFAQRVFLRCLKPKLVISPVCTGDYHSWAEVSRYIGIPALVIPQKALAAPANAFAKIEERYIGRAQVTDTFENAAAQSPLVTKYLKWSGYKGNMIESGNLIFARYDPGKREKRRKVFFEEISGDKKIIVWAPSMKTRKSRRFYVLETIDELTGAMEDVFAVVSRLEDVHLVFRIHPGDAITKEEIYSLLPVPANVTVSDTRGFEDVLALADLLISFSSTAVQEALINHIPVLLYDKWKRYNHLDAVGTKNGTPTKVSAAYYIDEKDHLASSIKWILEEHTTKKVPPGIFKEYAFLDNDEKFHNFLNFVEQCIE